jgi:hypothetical protein
MVGEEECKSLGPYTPYFSAPYNACISPRIKKLLIEEPFHLADTYFAPYF